MMSNDNELNHALNTESGKVLRGFIRKKLAAWSSIDSIREFPNAEEQALEVKVQKKVVERLMYLFDEMESRAEKAEEKKEDPRDSYQVDV